MSEVRKDKVGLISVYPKSGYWYNMNFFHYYTQLLNGGELKTLKQQSPKHMRGFNILNKKAEAIGLDFFNISHAPCIGYRHYDGEYKERLDSIDFYPLTIPHYEDVYEHREFSDPFLNEDVKLVYIYRNPLDQFVSYYNFSLHHIHKDSFLKGVSDITGQVRLFTMDNYIKHHMMWKLTKEMKPDNVMFVTYEDMYLDPKKSFGSISEFLGHDVSKHMDIFKKSIEMTSFENTKKRETKKKRALYGQQDKQGRHLRNGKIGQWKEYFSSEDIDFIEKRFNEFDLKLEDFQIE